jgi:hypothetical protein
MLLLLLLLLLQILRNQLNCTLPVEIAYRNEKEVHPGTIKALDAAVGPVHGLDLSLAPYPEHHNP